MAMQFARILLTVGTHPPTSVMLIGPAVQQFANQVITDYNAKFGHNPPNIDATQNIDLGGYQFQLIDRFNI